MTFVSVPEFPFDQGGVQPGQFLGLGVGKLPVQRRSQEFTNPFVSGYFRVHSPQIPRARRSRKSEISEYSTFYLPHVLQTGEVLPCNHTTLMQDSCRRMDDSGVSSQHVVPRRAGSGVAAHVRMTHGIFPGGVGGLLWRLGPIAS